MSSRLSQPTADFSTLVELLRRRALDQPTRVAYTYLLDGERQEVDLDHAGLDRRARAIAAELQSSGLSGERVLLLYPPGLEYVAGFFGCLYAGAIAVPVYPPRPNRSFARLASIIENARPHAALTTGATLSRLQPLAEKFPAFRTLATEILPDDRAREWREPALDGDSLALLQYTSGSTAEPKGVMLSHGNILRNQKLIRQAFEHTPDSTLVGWLPLYHDMGLIGNLLQPLYAGARCVLMAPEAFLLKPLRWLSAISKYRAHTSGGPNFAYNLCVRKIRPEQRATLDLSSWRVAFNGAEPIRAQDLDEFAAAFAPCGFRREAFFPCYGLAEATLMVSGGSKNAAPLTIEVPAARLSGRPTVEEFAEDNEVRTLVGCGGNLPEQKIVIAHPESRTQCVADEVGEIWVAGPGVALGYWNRAEETEQTFRAYLADTGDGPFLRTGDLGFLHDGELFVTGRLKDLIIIGGDNHYPQDIERTAEQSHPALAPGNCAAFSLDVAGEQQLAVMAEVGRRHAQECLRPDASGAFDSNGGAALNQEIVRAIRRAVAEEHDLRVHQVWLVRAGGVPKTSSGKIQRHLCRAQFLAHYNGARSDGEYGTEISGK
ncbi:MAG TPA: fatty acyl-AMP ligase [Candidatus Binatia bacterium]